MSLRLIFSFSLCSEMSLFGHTIPRRSHVVPNLYGILHDPEVFPEPERFDPERFLETDPESGAVRVRKVEEFVPFGVGRRVCLGRSLAEREVCSKTLSLDPFTTF